MTQTAAKIDRRILRTRALLREAMIELIQEQGYDNLSVQDITDRANVNRATFYLHYRDKDELLVKSMQDVYDDLLARLGPLLPQHLGDDHLHLELAMLNHVKEYFGFYRVMFGERGAPVFTVHLMSYMARVGLELYRPLLPPGLNPRVPLEAISYYYAGAEIGLITWWVQNDMPTPLEETAKMLHDLDCYSSFWALGLADS